MRVYTLLARATPRWFKSHHRARWFAYSGPYGALLPLKSGQRLYGIGYEVECSCGWKTRTGGAVKASVKEDHGRHIWDEYNKGDC